MLLLSLLVMTTCVKMQIAVELTLSSELHPIFRHDIKSLVRSQLQTFTVDNFGVQHVKHWCRTGERGE